MLCYTALHCRVADGLVLLPGDKAEALRWLAVLCSPVCGASLLVPLTGIDLEVRLRTGRGRAGGPPGISQYALTCTCTTLLSIY